MGWATREIGIASGVGAAAAGVESVRAELGGATLVAGFFVWSVLASAMPGASFSAGGSGFLGSRWCVLW
ncbi:hypothetical protein ERC79_20775 [Rhodococcus sp. ABRD24]|uniref:hypothetical protein n=1 Tax=Rhodococcus sp. ABRD24 TaxID=2507582 RepID=UPI00103D6E99|nr:hypothetical protein [Rhodococcus sp. ABRD24]QBJ98104.1 hypothetical protein ERC79_20775 [Rhodococcus sp. ABRD24]